MHRHNTSVHTATQPHAEDKQRDLFLWYSNSPEGPTQPHTEDRQRDLFLLYSNSPEGHRRYHYKYTLLSRWQLLKLS